MTLLSAAAASTSGLSPLAIALISGAAGVVGAMVGGIVTGYFSLHGERARQEFARETERKQRDYDEEQRVRRARGAARQWQRAFRVAELRYSVALKQDQWWPEQLQPTVFPDTPERREVASLLDDSQWEAVVDAEFTMELIQVLRLSAGNGLPPLDEKHRERLSQGLERVRKSVEEFVSLSS